VYYYGLSRTLCSVLEEMRKAHETRNFSYLLSLIEEAQSMGNRMEAALSDIKDLEMLRKEIKQAKKDLEKLKETKGGISG
jgi:prefoldin subunit 5